MPKVSKKTIQEEAKALALAKRRQTVCQYRLAGMSYRAIGEKLGISHEQARADEMAARAEVKAGTEESIDELRVRENERLDMLQSVLLPKMLAGDLVAGREWLRLSDRRARLNGLDRPNMLGEGEAGVIFGVVRIPEKATPDSWAAQALAVQKAAEAEAAAVLESDEE